MKGFIPIVTAALIIAAGASSASAQIITDGEIERGLRYRNTTPYDGRSATARYNHGNEAYFYMNGNAASLWYLDYLDRVDRARKFGYPMPINPYFDEPLPPPQAVQSEAVVVQPSPRIFLFRRFR